MRMFNPRYQLRRCLTLVVGACLLGGGTLALRDAPAGATGTATLYVNGSGTASSGCSAPGASACTTLQEGINAAYALYGTDPSVTVDVAAGTYDESDTINLPSGDTLTIVGAGDPAVNNGGTGTDLTIFGAGSATIEGVTISGASTSQQGGGIFTDTNLVATDDTFSNDAVSGFGSGGGAIFNDGHTLVLSDDTFSNDSASDNGAGGAIFMDGGTLSAVNDTFVNNSVPGGGGLGGALFDDGGTVTVANDTFSGNSAAGGTAGGIFNDNGTTTVTNSILNETSAEAGSCHGTITDGGYNVEADNDCGFGSTDAVSNANLNLAGSLASNGSSGPQTLAIGTNSSAYDEVPSGSCTVATDERGDGRPGVSAGGNTACDAGAYELQGITLTVTGTQVYGSSSPTFTVTPTGSLPGGVGISGTPTTCTVDGGTPITPTLAVGTHAIDPSSCTPTITLTGADAPYFVLNLAGGAFAVSAAPVISPSPTAFSISVDGSTSATVADGVSATLSETGLPPTATGTVTFAANGTTLCAISLSGLTSEVTACASSTALAPGNYHISASFSPTNGIFAGSNAMDSVSLTVSSPITPPPPPPLPPSTCNGTVSPGSVVGMAATADDHGYWIADAFGTVLACGDAPILGGVSATPTNPIVGIAPTPDGGGYYLVGSDGGVFAFGDAVFHGSAGDMKLNQPIVGMALDPATGGYWLVAADGGVFSFDAPFYGSTGNITLNKPIVGMAASRGGQGYWLVAADGGVFSFDAPYFGSTGNLHLNQPVVGMSADAATGGYWLVASDGGIFSFNAPFYGSTGNTALNEPIVGMETNATGTGYRFVASDGGIFDFGSSLFFGSAVPPSTP